MDAEDPASIRAASKTVQELVLGAPLPDDVEQALAAAWEEAFGARQNALAALRSSALAEDGVQSFAGQYLSVLGVTRQTLPQAFKKVVASLFSARALSYRAAHGYALDATGMGLCCLEMVRAKAAGVAFSRHPGGLALQQRVNQRPLGSWRNGRGRHGHARINGWFRAPRGE